MRRDWFSVPIEELGLTPRGLHRARAAGASTVGDLCQLTDEQLAATSGGLAELSRRDIREKLGAVGLRLRDDKAGPCVVREWGLLQGKARSGILQRDDKGGDP